MDRIDLDLFASFVTVVDADGFGRAAERLGRTQPAISQQIKRLEEQVGQTLLTRRGKALRLTQAGERLLPYARRLLRLSEEALREVARPAAKELVRVGMPSDFAQVLLPTALGRFAAAYPNVSLDMRCELSGVLLTALETGSLDLAVAMTVAPPSVPAVESWREPLTWVGARKPPAMVGNELPLIVHPEGCVYRRRMTEALDLVGRPWRIVMTTPSLTSLISAVKAGFGLTVLSRTTVPGDLVCLQNRDLPALGDVSMGVYRHPDGLGRGARRLTDVLIARLLEARPAEARQVRKRGPNAPQPRRAKAAR